MALDSYLVSRMCSWARWAMRGADGGVEDYTPEINENAAEIDLCMAALSATRLDLYAAVFAHYRRNDLTVEAKLQHLGCCKRTYYVKIDLAHNIILGFLNDLSCGLELPVNKIILKSA